MQSKLTNRDLVFFGYTYFTDLQILHNSAGLVTQYDGNLYQTVYKIHESLAVEIILNEKMNSFL
jgi:hypothetical protein